MELRDRDWEVLLRSIENGKCVLLLGPNLDVASAKGSTSNLSTDLAKNLQAELTGLTPDNGSLSLVAQLFENEFSREDLEVEVARYYAGQAEHHQSVEDAAFAALAKIPFPLYLSLRHDSLLQGYLARAGREPWVEHYNFVGDRRDTLLGGRLGSPQQGWGNVARPLVYQLLGTLEADGFGGGAVLTETDHIRFLEAVVSGNPKLPTDLTNYLKDKNFLFIGFGMQNFYLRILLHVLSVARSTKSFAFEIPAGQADEGVGTSDVDDSILFFQSTGFNTLKIMYSDPGAFLDALAERWQQRFPNTSFQDQTAASTTVLPNNRPSVFISYVSEDQAQAEELSRILSDEGLEPWIDKEGLRAGDRWNDKLEDAISSDVDFFVVLQSSAMSNRRESYVHLEVSLALERQKRRPPDSKFIFPLILDKEAQRLDAIERVSIQSMEMTDLLVHCRALAKDIRREHARWQKK